MVFANLFFLYLFLPVNLILYFSTKNRVFRNAVLIFFSLFFYAWGEPVWVTLLIFSATIDYFHGLIIEKNRGKIGAKLALISSLVLNLGLLGIFKYSGFFVENINFLTGLDLPVPEFALPIGISFYTFQILSYNVDVYRGDVPAQRNPINLAAYIALFPQLIAGPIVRYSHIEKELQHRTHSFEKCAEGVRRFVLGLSKKILIANVLGELCDTFKASSDKSVAFYWIYAIAFCLHVYFDFSGYSDMAIGLGKIFGFTFMENFNYPFISKSATEFWRRWHISLGSWFRDYVYIPMGGSRVGKLRMFFNIFVVWMLTGFWHGAAWNFIIWGLYFAVLLIIEKVFILKYLNKSKVLSHIYLLFFVIISFVIFNAASMGEAFSYIGAMFGAGDIPFSSAETLYYLRSYIVVFVVAIIGSTPLPKLLANKAKFTKFVEPVVLLILLAVCTAYLVDGSFNPFLYFRF